MSTTVLITDKTDAVAAEIFKREGIPYEIVPSLAPEELANKLATGNYGALIVRSATKIKAPEIFEKAKGLKLIVRAGSGTDNIDAIAASKAGIIVENTPGGNSIATAEHALALMFALARNITTVNAATHNGIWIKGKHKGIELTGKTLGLIGGGKIGGIVNDRAKGLKMDVVVSDPYLDDDKARKLGIKKVELDELLRVSDFISLHLVLTQETRGIINNKTIAMMKPGVRLINCARGPLVDDDALIEALKSGRVAQAALDVFTTEPDGIKKYMGMENVIMTPHQSASTIEAQTNVAEAAANQIVAFIKRNDIRNAVNMTAIPPETAEYMPLGLQLGLLAGQIVDGAVKKVTIEYGGETSNLERTEPIRNTVLEGILSPIAGGVNVVSAPYIAEDRGIRVSEHRHTNGSSFKRLLRMEVVTDKGALKLVGSLFSGQPRLIEINDVPLETPLKDDMIYVCHANTSGMFAAVSKVIGDQGINIRRFKGDTSADESHNVVLITPDVTEPEALADVVARIAVMDGVTSVRNISFNRHDPH